MASSGCIDSVTSDPKSIDKLTYLSGFGNDFETESHPGALPQGQNSPQKCPYGLYAEQLSGSAFTAPRGKNERSWLYRIRPGVKHNGKYLRVQFPHWKSAPNFSPESFLFGQLRWDPPPYPTEPTTFIEGIRTVTTAGDVHTQVGMAAHYYLFNKEMVDEYFFNADGEFLIVPQEGGLRIATELGVLDVQPLEICIIPRGTIFKVLFADRLTSQARGYICENYGSRFTLPERGPIGANCLANPRDFKAPVAWYEEKESACELMVKWCGTFHTTTIGYSPLDVVAWHGNYVPYKYDLMTYSPVGAILFDHPDPSIFTVLTAPTGEAGTANVDFVIFPPRWIVAEHTFRPPWYHRNIMSEFMGLICGRYDAKEEGFLPGGMSLHNMMMPHGPDTAGFEKATTADLGPQKLDHTMAFMFETRFPQHVTEYGATLGSRQDEYQSCWDGLARKFTGIK